MRPSLETARGQFADRPPLARDPFDPSLHVVCQTSRLPPSVVQDYLSFCRRVLPNRTSRFGVAFFEDIDVTKALALLQACDFDVQMAKFKVVFPVLARYCDATGISFSASVDYGAVLDEHILKTTMASSTKEKFYFDSLHIMIIDDKKQVSYKTIRPFVEEGLRNKCPVPMELKKELERCKKARRDIQKVLDEPRVLVKIDRELALHRGLPILPENLDDLVAVRETVVEAQRRVREFLSPENFQKKEFSEMSRLVEEFRARNIAEECSHEFRVFYSFFRKTAELYETVDLITRPAVLPDGAPKVSMAEAYQLLDDLSNSPLEHKVKMQMLVVVIFRKEIESEKCMMFCEDDRTTDIGQFVLYVADLRKGALDFDQIVRRTELKIRTLEFLNFLHLNVGHPESLDENLGKVEALAKLQSVFYVRETAEFAGYLSALARLRDVAVRLTGQTCRLANFLFEDDELVDVGDFHLLLKQANFAEDSPHLFPFVDEVGKRLTAFARLVETMTDFREADTARLCQRFRQVFELGLQNAFLVDAVRGELAGRIEIEFFVSRMAEKYSTAACPFKHTEFSEVLDQRTRLYATFDECRDRVQHEIGILKDGDTLAFFQTMAADRKALDSEIEQLFHDPNRLATDLETFEEAVRLKFKDRELVVKAQTKARFVGNKARVDLLLRLLHARHFPEVTEMEALMTAADGSVEAAAALLETHWTGFLDTYQKARQTPPKFPEKDLRELLDLLTKKRSHEDPLLESISGQIRACRDQLHVLEAEAETQLGYLEKATPAFVLKTLRLMTLATRLHLAGVQPAFLATVDHFIDLYRRTEAHLALTSRKTLLEVRGLLAKYEDLHLFSVNALRLKKLLALAEAFVGRVEPLDFEVRGKHLDAEEVTQSLQAHLRLSEYDVDWVDECLELNRRSFPLLHEDEFLEFLNKKGKRIKKYNVVSNAPAKNPSGVSDAVEALRSVLPAATDPRATPFCVCREYKEVGEMVQPGKCGEWFHLRCLGVTSAELERREASCVGCDLLERKRSPQLEALFRRKIPAYLFLELGQTTELLSNFILDPSIDFVRGLGTKLKELSRLVREVRTARLTGQSAEEVRKVVHVAALLFLWIPVVFQDVERELLAAWEDPRPRPGRTAEGPLPSQSAGND